MSLSRFAGLFNAVNFAYGCSSPGLAGLPGPLVVDIAPAATGAGTLTLQFGSITLTDGTIWSPLATTAPILVGSGSAAETVTPSAVSVPSPGIYDSSTVTATFSNLHGKGDPISSATFGLQEALNFAGTYGGGQVIIDARWALMAGSGAAAIIAAATLPSNVTIWDNRAGASFLVQTAEVTVTNAQIKALNSTPVLVLAAPGANKAIDIFDIFDENVFLTAAFAAGGTMTFSYGSGGPAAAATIAATFLTSPVASQVIKVAGVLATNLASDVLNKGIYLAAAAADFTTGGGSMKLRINYRVLSNL